MSAADHHADLAERLHRLLEKGAQEASRRHEPVLVSTVVRAPSRDPVRLFQGAGAQERALWEQPSQGFSLVVIGAAARLIGHGGNPFAEVAVAWRRLRSNTLADATHEFPFALPICLGGFSFDPLRPRDPCWEAYPDALLIVPRFLFVSSGGSSWFCLSLMTTPDSDAHATADAAMAELSRLLSTAGEESERPIGDLMLDEEVAPEAWKAVVAQIADDIRRGTLEKTVLARRVRIRSTTSLTSGPVLDRLRRGYGNCTILAFALGDRCFLGATPERLVRLDGRNVRTDCLAGSTARGASEEEDRSLAEALLADAKERHEHALVVRAVCQALAPLCSDLAVPETPGLLRMPNVQHLHTPVLGVLRDEAHILEIVERLHPTPASGGLPRQAALSLIRRYEPFDRGWYAGPVGWIDGHGGGEFAVAIRSALLSGNEALLYAGCGIVAGSDPDLEYRESCLKLRPMLWALNGKQP